MVSVFFDMNSCTVCFSFFPALNEVVNMKDSEVCDVSKLLVIPAAVSAKAGLHIINGGVAVLKISMDASLVSYVLTPAL